MIADVLVFINANCIHLHFLSAAEFLQFFEGRSHLKSSESAVVVLGSKRLVVNMMQMTLTVLVSTCVLL